MTSPESLPSTPCPDCAVNERHHDGCNCETCDGSGRIPATNTSETPNIDVHAREFDGEQWVRMSDFQKVLDFVSATPALQDEPESDCRGCGAKYDKHGTNHQLNCPVLAEMMNRSARPSAKRLERDDECRRCNGAGCVACDSRKLYDLREFALEVRAAVDRASCAKHSPDDGNPMLHHQQVYDELNWALEKRGLRDTEPESQGKQE